MNIKNIINKLKSGENRLRQYQTFYFSFGEKIKEKYMSGELSFSILNYTDIYNLKRKNKWFPFEKEIIKIGFYKFPGTIDFVMDNIEDKYIYVDLYRIKNNYPYKEKKLYTVNGKEAISLNISDMKNYIAFLNIEIERNLYTQLMIIALYIAVIILIFTKFLWATVLSIIQLAIQLLALQKDFFAYLDIIIIVLFFFGLVRVIKTSLRKKKNKAGFI